MTMSELKSILKVRLKQVRDGRVRFKVGKVTRPAEVFEAVQRFYRGADREMLSVLCLDAQSYFTLPGQEMERLWQPRLPNRTSWQRLSLGSITYTTPAPSVRGGAQNAETYCREP